MKERLMPSLPTGRENADHLLDTMLLSKPKPQYLGYKLVISVRNVPGRY